VLLLINVLILFLSLERLCRNTGNIAPVGSSVISTPSAVLRTGSGRNLRSLTSVGDDNPVFRRCNTASDGRRVTFFRKGRRNNSE
jgi:hypothetical protein